MLLTDIRLCERMERGFFIAQRTELRNLVSNSDTVLQGRLREVRVERKGPKNRDRHVKCARRLHSDIF